MKRKLVIGFFAVMIVANAVAALFAWRPWRRTSPAEPASASEALVQSRCASCHAKADPAMLARADWRRVMTYMRKLAEYKAGTRYPDEEYAALLKYHLEGSPETLPKLPPDPPDGGPAFEAKTIGRPASGKPRIANVNVTDLDRDGRPDVLVCDADTGEITWIRRKGDAWEETTLASVGPAAHTEVLDFDGDGRLDIAVAVMGVMYPTDDKVGKVVLLRGDGAGGFAPRTLLEKVGRVTDVQPADVDRDGDLDLVVAIYGHVREGRIGWIEQRPGGEVEFHAILEKPGGIHVPVADLNGDGAPDFVAVLAQETEQVVACLNDGKGGFETRALFSAGTPLFGSSGIQLVDLDRDGDLDILHTNGDVFDVPEAKLESMLRPYHGVRWLENRGGLKFEAHELVRFYGAYRAVAGDLDGDGDLDVVAVSLANDWSDRSRRSVILLENDGKQNFTPRGIAGEPIHLATAVLGDLDGDGRLDIVAGSMHQFPPFFDRVGRVTWWRNVIK